MIVFPFAKVNLGLHVLRKRADGYHDIESVLLPIPLHDALEAVSDPGIAQGMVEFTRSGIPVPGPSEDDLCLKAIVLVKEIRRMPGLRMHLHKTIPIGAGLGGGSSDATHTLLLLNDLLGLDLTPNELHAMAAELGSDCPFFLDRTPQLVEGRGERSQRVTVDLKGHWLVLVHPSIHVSTAEVYQDMRPANRGMDLLRALVGPIATWQTGIGNDMESHVFAKHEEIATIKRDLLDQGALYAAMSGSGSSVFGIFKDRPPLTPPPKGYKRWCLPM